MRDSALGYFYVQPEALAAAIGSITDRDPALRLVRNRDGNISIVDPAIDRMIGVVQVYDAEVIWYEVPRLR